jgi:hypothetical protein
MNEPVTGSDARRLSRYLIGEAPTPEEAERWTRAVALRDASVTSACDRRIWAAIMRHPALVGFADAGLALVDPLSPVRHRILLMLAILEASPHHHRRFLAAPWPRIALIALAARGAWAAIRSVLGVLWVRAMGAGSR